LLLLSPPDPLWLLAPPPKLDKLLLLPVLVAIDKLGAIGADCTFNDDDDERNPGGVGKTFLTTYGVNRWYLSAISLLSAGLSLIAPLLDDADDDDDVDRNLPFRDFSVGTFCDI
jgi:hypothetical protein